MLRDLEQTFSALSSRDKMTFLHWAAESVGAHLDTVFGLSKEEVEVHVLSAQREQNTEADAAAVQQAEQLEIPGFLKRKKG